MAVAQKPIFTVVIDEEIRFSKTLLVAAWSEQEVLDYIEDHYGESPLFETSMEDFDELTYRNCYIDGEVLPGQNVGRNVTPDLDVGGVLPSEE